MKNNEEDISALGSLIITPMRKVLEDSQHQGAQYLWRSKKLNKPVTNLEPVSSDLDGSPVSKHLTVVSNDGTK